MWTLLLPLYIAIAASSDENCHPFFNEMSCLQFSNNAELQFIELSVTDDCYKNEEKMKSLKLNNYGILIVNTKSPLMGREHNFHTTTFVDFNNQKWPKSRAYQAFFTVGSDAGQDTVPVSSFPRGQKRINFNFFNARKGLPTCTRFVSWPRCNQVHDSRQKQSLLQFFGQEVSSPAPRFHSENYYRDGQTVFLLLQLQGKEAKDYFATTFSYVETTDTGNLQFKDDRLIVTLEKQKWLSSKVVDVVVFSPSDDVSKVIPMDYLDEMWPQHLKEMIYQLLPSGALTSGKSLSLCGHRWAVTDATPGSDNSCDDDGKILLQQWLRIEDDTANSQDRRIEEQEGGRREVSTIPLLQTSPAPLPPENIQSPLDDALDIYFSVPAAEEVQDSSAHISPLDERHTRLENRVAKLLEIVQGIAHRQKQFGEQQKMLTIESQQASSILANIREEMRERSELQSIERLLQNENLRRRFGLHRDAMEDAKFVDDLKLLVVNEERLSSQQIEDLRNKTYLRYYRDENHPEGDFMRCALCNRKTTQPFDVEEGFRKCESDSGFPTGSNLLGENSILCVKRLAHLTQSEGRPRRLLGRLLERINTHENTAKHKQHLEEYHKEAEAVMRSTAPDDISATVTSTFAAYIIAKEGLPFSKQFPLLVMSMRSGSVGVTVHHDPTTVRRMITAFAVHMKYDLVRYVVDHRLPFTLLLDGSSSSRGVKWIVFLIRTLSPQHRPITFHFYLTEVESESASHIVKALLQTFDKTEPWADKPGLSNTFRNHAMRNMLAMSSDGAAVMSGQISGVFAKLKELVAFETSADLHPRQTLMITVCMAHKLNLAVKAQKGRLFKLAQSVVMELYHLFGSTVRTTGRSIYKKAAQKMCFPDLQMSALFTVRWSASFASSISNILRVYPVILQALVNIRSNRRLASSLIIRARLAHMILSDARTYIALHHLNTTMHELSILSQSMQREEGLLVDNLQKWRTLIYSISKETLSRKTTRSLLEQGTITDVENDQPVRLDLNVLENYYDTTNRRILAYNPRAFSDYSPDRCSEPYQEERDQLLDYHRFRDLDDVSFRTLASVVDESDLNFNLEDAPESSALELQHCSLSRQYKEFAKDTTVYSSIKTFYSDMKEALTLHLVSKSHELNHNDLVALERHVILDVIDFNGDFEGAFAEYVPENANFLNRGCPNYVDMETNTLDPSLRQRLILESIDAIQQYCNIPDLKSSMIQFYNTIPASTRKFSKWPTNFREQSDSLHFYRTLLQNSKEMNIPEKVEQAIKCLIVLPGSNADPERSFSAANRLSRDERSKIKTETLDHIMTVQRNGPSVLTVKVQQLASQWMHPAPGLGLSPGMPSTLVREGSLMKGDARELASLHVRRYMVIHGLNARDDANDIRSRLLQEELAKMSIFSVGSATKPE